MNLTSINSQFTQLAEKSQSWTWPLLRILGASMFVTHGYGKMFGERAQPFLSSVRDGAYFFGIDIGVNTMWIAGVIEFYGGLLLVVGLFTRWVALLAAVLMVMAYMTAHMAWFPTLNRGELATMYLLVYLIIFAFGPGKFSLDHKLFGSA